MVTESAQDRAADMSADGTEPGAVRPTQAYGVVFGDLERWSKDELISTLCPILPHEQMWEPADA